MTSRCTADHFKDTAFVDLSDTNIYVRREDSRCKVEVIECQGNLKLLIGTPG